MTLWHWGSLDFHFSYRKTYSNWPPHRAGDLDSLLQPVRYGHELSKGVPIASLQVRDTQEDQDLGPLHCDPRASARTETKGSTGVGHYGCHRSLSHTTGAQSGQKQLRV